MATGASVSRGHELNCEEFKVFMFVEAITEVALAMFSKRIG